MALQEFMSNWFMISQRLFAFWTLIDVIRLLKSSDVFKAFIVTRFGLLLVSCADHSLFLVGSFLVMFLTLMKLLWAPV